MKPVKRDKREAFRNGPEVSVRSINDESNDINSESLFGDFMADAYNEDGDMAFIDDQAPSPEAVEAAEKEADKMTDEEIKIKALKQAIDIAKLMSDVDTEGVIKIAGKVAKFIKG